MKELDRRVPGKALDEAREQYPSPEKERTTEEFQVWNDEAIRRFNATRRHFES